MANHIYLSPGVGDRLRALRAANQATLAQMGHPVGEFSTMLSSPGREAVRQASDVGGPHRLAEAILGVVQAAAILLQHEGCQAALCDTAHVLGIGLAEMEGKGIPVDHQAADGLSEFLERRYLETGTLLGPGHDF